MNDRTVVDGPMVALEISGLKCDAPGCGYRDNGAPHAGETYRDYLNRPCPRCGASLLTEADYRLMMRIERWSKIFNAIGRFLGMKSRENAKAPIIPLEMRGDGSLTIHPAKKPSE